MKIVNEYPYRGRLYLFNDFSCRSHEKSVSEKVPVSRIFKYTLNGNDREGERRVQYVVVRFEEMEPRKIINVRMDNRVESKRVSYITL